MSDPFLSRWSRRKQAVTQGKTPPEPETTPAPKAKGSGQAPGGEDVAALTDPAPVSPPPAPDEPLPSLSDVKELTPASDFQPFMRPGVTADVRNAAMKRLFTDPHFNIMDGLDVYIEDYNQPDPLPAGMLQQMVGAQLLNLVPKDAPAPEASLAPPLAQEPPGQSPHDSPAPAVVAQSSHCAASSAAAMPDHDNTDLQLQPNPAAAADSPGPSPG